jgi:hypothetical protein
VTASIPLALSAAIAFAQLAPAPPRDRAPAPRVGTGAIKGRVVDGETGRALARARVRLTGQGGQRPVIVTDDSGAFAFAALPAGSYGLSVDRATYLPTQYPEPGQTMRSGYRPLVLADGQILDGLSVALSHGGGIAGRVVDAYGDPAEYAGIQALRLPRSGRGRPQPAGGASTNDLGEFRIVRLTPGKYVVVAQPRPGIGFGQADATDTQPLATFYPGVPSVDQAQPLTIERGRVVTGVDIQVIESSAALVTGTVVDAAGQPVSRVSSLSVTPVGREITSYQTFGGSTKPDGSFELRLAPGEYDVEARVQPESGRPPASVIEQAGRVRLSVSGEVSGVTIAVGPGARITGRLVFDAASPAPPFTGSTLQGVSLSAEGGSSCRPGRGELMADATFTMDGVFGTCVVRAGGSFGPWQVKSIIHEGKDLLDRPVTFDAGQQLHDVQVILTDRRAEITFHVVDERGAPTREYVALIFPVDRSKWSANLPSVRPFVPFQMPDSGDAGGAIAGSITGGLARLTRGTPGATGAVVTTGVAGRPAAAPGSQPAAVRPDVMTLPPGEYFAVAIDDVDRDGWRDVDFLQQLSRAALRVTLDEGTTRELNLRRLKLADVPPER